MMIEIPKQLQSTTFRFILLKPKTKIPFETNWQETAHYSFDDEKLLKHLKEGGNYGVKGGFGNLVIIDADKKAIEEIVEKTLPKTFTVLTGNERKHYYYLCKDLPDNIRLSQGNENQGDIQVKGKQVVGPESIHPNGKQYKVLVDIPITEINIETLLGAFKDFLKEKKELETESLTLDIGKVIDLNKLTNKGNEYYGEHPLHGSDTGMNFWVNTDKNLWHCFRHNTGGNALTWIAVLNGLITCEQAHKGALHDKTVFKQVTDFARKAGYSISETKAKQSMEVSRLDYQGLLAEVIFDGQESRFAFLEGDKVKKSNSFKIKGTTYFPANNEALKQGCVILPKDAMEYESEEKLLQEIQEFIHTYLDVTPDFEVFASYYVLLSWVADCVDTVPYLRALGDWGTGKSRFLKAIGNLCYKPIRITGAVTPAPIYRLQSFWKGTLIIEEADRKESDETDDITKILNCGFEKGNPVLRCDKEHPNDIEVHDAFGCKVISSRFAFADHALESRCLTENMIETPRNEIPIILPKKFYAWQENLRQKLLLYRLKNYNKMDAEKIQEIDLGEGIEKRIKQATSSFLLILANKPEMLEKFKVFITAYQSKIIEARGGTLEGLIVQYLYDKLDLDNPANNEITTHQIAEGLNEEGANTTTRSIGLHLKAIGLKNSVKKAGGKSKRLLVLDAESCGILIKLVKRYIPLKVWGEKMEKLHKLHELQNYGGTAVFNNNNNNTLLADKTLIAEKGVTEPPCSVTTVTRVTEGPIGITEKDLIIEILARFDAEKTINFNALKTEFYDTSFFQKVWKELITHGFLAEIKPNEFELSAIGKQWLNQLRTPPL